MGGVQRDLCKVLYIVATDYFIINVIIPLYISPP